jgi:hypothetical protein
MHQLPLFSQLPRLGRPKSPRLVARFSVRLRREGGSLSMTIPRHIVRDWKLEPGVRLVLRSTDEGVLLHPRYFLPYSWSGRKRDGGSPLPDAET